MPEWILILRKHNTAITESFLVKRLLSGIFLAIVITFIGYYDYIAGWWFFLSESDVVPVFNSRIMLVNGPIGTFIMTYFFVDIIQVVRYMFGKINSFKAPIPVVALILIVPLISLIAGQHYLQATESRSFSDNRYTSCEWSEKFSSFSSQEEYERFISEFLVDIDRHPNRCEF